jgi:hypothetical protein
MSAKVASFFVRQINRMGRIRDAVYLDTNAWSTLAKREVPVEPLRRWIEQSGYHLWLARFQLAELARSPQLARPFAELLREMPVVMVDHELNEFQGRPWHKVEVACDEYIHLTDEALFDEFLSQMMNGPIREASARLVRDGEDFRRALEQALEALPPETPRSWSEFPKRLDDWIRGRCLRQGVAIDEQSLANRECYAGLRLAYGVLFIRYFLNRQRWRSSDYVDFLHAGDMPYAGIVVTERGLAECVRQLGNRPEVTCPELVADLGWLRSPSPGRSFA